MAFEGSVGVFVGYRVEPGRKCFFHFFLPPSRKWRFVLVGVSSRLWRLLWHFLPSLKSMALWVGDKLRPILFQPLVPHCLQRLKILSACTPSFPLPPLLPQVPRRPSETLRAGCGTKVSTILIWLLLSGRCVFPCGRLHREYPPRGCPMIELSTLWCYDRMPTSSAGSPLLRRVRVFNVATAAVCKFHNTIVDSHRVLCRSVNRSIEQSFRADG